MFSAYQERNHEEESNASSLPSINHSSMGWLTMKTRDDGTDSARRWWVSSAGAFLGSTSSGVWQRKCPAWSVFAAIAAVMCFASAVSMCRVITGGGKHRRNRRNIRMRHIKAGSGSQRG